MEELRSFQENADKDYEYNSFLLKELEEIEIREGLLEEMEAEYEKISNVEMIKETLAFTLEGLNDENAGILNSTREIKNGLAKLVEYGKEFQEIASRMESIMIEMDDIFMEVQALSDSVEIDPNSLEDLNNKIQKNYDLQRKHKTQSANQLLKIKEELSEKVSKTKSVNVDILKVERTLKESEKKLKELCGEIHRRRFKKIPFLKNKIESSLKELGMPNIRFQINIEKQDVFLPNGMDKINFLFSANKGAEYGSIKKIASGGERSRIMLVIKSILAEYTFLPTIIFDEIDVGISGEIARKVSLLMERMAKRMQVITITHLPQIAAKGHEHLKVFKSHSETRTDTNIKQLTRQERIMEIAEMIDGKHVSSSAVKHAEGLLQQS